MKNTTSTIILVKPQMGENIGAAARVMLNFGLYDMRIVNPRDGWPNEKALAMAAGGVKIVESAKIFENTEDAIADLEFLFAATARMRDMKKPVINSSDIADNFMRYKKCGIMFGAEKSGLSNEDVTLADKIVTIPVNDEYTSLNLAQSVAVIAYELYQNDLEYRQISESVKTSPATKEDMIHFFNHLECELEKSGFFRVREKSARMKSNIRNIFNSMNPDKQDIRTLRGIITSLTKDL